MQLMTLILQLLFEPHFKQVFTRVILGHYSQLMEEWSVKPPQAVMPLDMITVQLFNDEVRNFVPQTSQPKQGSSAGFVPIAVLDKRHLDLHDDSESSVDEAVGVPPLSPPAPLPPPHLFKHCCADLSSSHNSPVLPSGVL